MSAQTDQNLRRVCEVVRERVQVVLPAMHLQRSRPIVQGRRQRSEPVRLTGEVLERIEMPAGTMVSGLESDGGDRFFCGGGTSGKMRVIRRPRRAAAAARAKKAM